MKYSLFKGVLGQGDDQLKMMLEQILLFLLQYIHAKILL